MANCHELLKTYHGPWAPSFHPFTSKPTNFRPNIPPYLLWFGTTLTKTPPPLAMKIFNWVHRRFLHVHSGITSLQDDKGIERNETLKVDAETRALLGHDGHVMVDVLTDWKEGIFAIGTLAIGPLEATITAKCELLTEQVEEDVDDVDGPYHDEETCNYVNVIDDDEYDDDRIESSPLMKMAFFSHELEKLDIDVEIACKAITHESINAVDDDGSKLRNDNDVCDVNKDEQECQVKRRVTLADLFLEESLKETKHSTNYAGDDKDYLDTGKNNLKIKRNSHVKNGISKARKLLKEELRPIKKLNQFVKRMMKRKIHPDMMEEGKMEEDMPLQPSKDLDAAYESASLLLLQV
ncbi:hypothetical protein Cgig2_030358 [Carnegiea gigantea]|uniref:Protein TILLER ANGLE CONTROL 1 n=1 Tax=Carnegiea gigantea TaxID=171969 RepID=A0A9Q1KKV1_9CARY|nr:hypothetical protein Cgig2_030358 [Carnegiea gigantea]